MQSVGYNFRMNDIQASLGSSQLKKINRFMNFRRKICKNYDKFFSKQKNVSLVQQSFRKESANHLYVLRFNFKKIGKTRNELMSYLEKNNIITQVHYIPVVMHPYYKKKGYDINKYPQAKNYYDECLSIPCFYKLSANSQTKVIKLIQKFLQ